MLGRYGRVVAALGGLTLVGVATCSASAATEPKQKGAPPNAASAKADGQERMTAYERESLLVSRLANGISERANVIANAQREYAFLSLFLGVCGVSFTGIAAFFAWRATHWAKDAAGHTQAAASSASAALAHDKKVDEVQVRPYVYLSTESIEMKPNFVAVVQDFAPIVFTIKNFGQTPAKRVRYRAKCYVGGYWSDDFASDLEGQAIIHLGDLPPGHERSAMATAWSDSWMHGAI